MQRAAARDDGDVTVEVDRNGLEVLDRGECLELLAMATLGRLAVTVGALPVILPINFRLLDDRIVFRTGAGTKLDAATSGAVVAFEADDIDRFSHEGWSVVVTGVASEVADPAQREALSATGIPHWARDDGERLVALSTEVVSGRRLRADLSPPTPAG